MSLAKCLPIYSTQRERDIEVRAQLYRVCIYI